MAKTFVFSTYGTRGDLFPYLAIGRELQLRGHRVVIATSEKYRADVQGRGMEFRPIRPESPTSEQAKLMMHPVKGTEYLFQRLLLPALRESIDDLLVAVQNADVLISHTTSLAGPIVAQLSGIQWVSSVVSPLALLGDDVALPALPRVAEYPAANRAVLALLKRQLGMKLKETQKIRTELGISPGDNALWSDGHSPLLELCLWDEKFAPVAGHGVRKAVGFCTLADEAMESHDVAEFLREGEPPLLFVAASHGNSKIWESESISAAKALGKRAILLGADSFGREEGILKCHFIPLEPILPRVAGMVHFGGIGTLALGLRAGTPMLLVPRSHDQPDNARRAKKLGIARVLAPNRYHAGAVEREVGRLLEDEAMAGRLREWREEFRDGASSAAEGLEKVTGTL